MMPVFFGHIVAHAVVAGNFIHDAPSDMARSETTNGH